MGPSDDNAAATSSAAGRQDSVSTAMTAAHNPDQLDHEKHEHPATMSDSDESSSSGHEPQQSRHSLSRTTSAVSGRSIARIASEVRDGFSNQRDLELGGCEAENADSPGPGGSQGKENKDPNLVTWDGADDPENPKAWAANRKWAAVLSGPFQPRLPKHTKLVLVLTATF